MSWTQKGQHHVCPSSMVGIVGDIKVSKVKVDFVKGSSERLPDEEYLSHLSPRRALITYIIGRYHKHPLHPLHSPCVWP